jgi:multidrug efflux pump subunit AcrB
VRVATSGDFKVGLPKLNLEPQRQIPIRVRLDRALRTDLDAIGRLTVPGKNGPVQLASVASISMDSGPAQVNPPGPQPQRDPRSRARPARAG